MGNSRRTKQSKKTGISIIIPSLSYKHTLAIKKSLIPNDQIIEFNGESMVNITPLLNKKISESRNNCVVVINPLSELKINGVIDKIRSLYNNKTILFDSESELSVNSWVVISKDNFVYPTITTTSIYDVHREIISNNTQSYKEETNPIQIHETPTGISIIIPFMFNGDRWDLFVATIERLYECTKMYNNIEIIVHESSKKRHISSEFIKKYNLVYLFSEYHGVFHRAWNLNVSGKHIAKGSTLVFMDADLIIDNVWVKELLSCDKTRPYVGWGKMKNLNASGTKKYLKTGQVNGEVQRIRIPSSISAAAGINIIPKDMFFEMGGWPESYKGKGYGGEDNSLSYKMTKLGMYNEKW